MQKSDSLSPRAQRKRDAKTQKILETAETIIVEEGLDALTIHQLARTLDYAPGALYRYFSSKEELIAELSCRAVQRIHDVLKQIEQENYGQAEESADLICVVRLVHSAYMYGNLAQSDPASHLLVSSLLGDPKHLLNDTAAVRVHAETMAVLTSFTTLVQSAEETKAIKVGPSAERAIAFWAGLQGIVQLRKVARRDTGIQAMVNPEKIAKRFVYDLLIGWGAQDEQIQQAYQIVKQQSG